MKPMIKKISAYLLLFVAFSLWSTVLAAWTLDRFVVKISTNPAKTNEAIDLTIQAVDKNSEVIKNYEWDIYIEVDGLSSKDVTLPNDWVYTFLPEDQGSKIFNKWLVFKKEWEFKIKITDVIDDSKIWFATLAVKGWSSVNDGWDIKISSPTSGWSETSSSLNIIAITTKPNSPYEINLDSIKIKEWLTSSDWGVNTFIEWVKWGDRVLWIKIFDIDGKILAENLNHKFKVIAPDLDLLKSITVSPGQSVQTTDMITMTVKTSTNASSVEALVGDKAYILDKTVNWEFVKNFKIASVWQYPVSLNIASDWNTKSYKTNIIMNVTQAQAWIQNVKVELPDANNAKLTWTIEWKYSSYEVKIGTKPDQLAQTSKSTQQLFTFRRNPSTVYYAQIFWLDANWQNVWTPSKVITINIKSDWIHWAACIVDNLEIIPKKIDWKYYLTWNSVEDIEKYAIYQAQTQTVDYSAMTKIGETVVNQFEYPFDPHALKNEYAYYTVVATCKWWETIVLQHAKKVQVWPLNWMMYCGLLFVFIYWSKKLILE